jgi:endonuclease/exonuclease/phosphatase family metal-dependent hydrolase
VPLIVAGDFNQDRDRSGWYGTRRGRELLAQALHDVDLVCMTDEDVVATGKLRESHLVDHIAICRRWAAEHEVRLNCWEKTDPDGTHLSDHPTVAIDLIPTTPTNSEQLSADPSGSPSP